MTALNFLQAQEIRRLWNKGTDTFDIATEVNRKGIGPEIKEGDVYNLVARFVRRKWKLRGSKLVFFVVKERTVVSARQAVELMKG